MRVSDLRAGLFFTVRDSRISNRIFYIAEVHFENDKEQHFACIAFDTLTGEEVETSDYYKRLLAYNPKVTVHDTKVVLKFLKEARNSD